MTVEEQAKIPPGLPRDGPTISYWQDPPSDIADHRTTEELPAVSDYAIIGSGISGAFIAYNLLTKKPNASVLLLEARQATSGATGRNGGHTKAASVRTPMGKRVFRITCFAREVSPSPVHVPLV